MTFENWMRHQGLSESSIRKYEGALSRTMSRWAIEAGLTDIPLTSIQSHNKFQDIAYRLRTLPIYQERNERGHNMYSSALNIYTEYLTGGYENDIEADIDAILSKNSATKTEKSNLIKARIGQGLFRQKLITYWKGCAVTRYEDTSILIASHIKPWRSSDDTERLDYFNGLLLLPNLDKTFDVGLISFASNGGILISPLLEQPDILSINTEMKIDIKDNHQKYIQFHREHVYRNT